MGEPFDCWCVSDAIGGRYVKLIAPVVFHGWADVVGLHTVCVPRSTLFWGFVDKFFRAWYCQWCLVEVVYAKETLVRRQVRLSTRGTEEVDGNVGLWD